VWPEPFGIAALEAMSFGKPVIASNTGGLPEIVRSGENGILVEPGDHLALARAITTLYRDQGEILRMGKNAARLLRQNFDSEIVIPRI
jgi:glycosyltransferase involved in cell wall biosynthesis